MSLELGGGALVDQGQGLIFLSDNEICLPLERALINLMRRFEDAFPDRWEQS